MLDDCIGCLENTIYYIHVMYTLQSSNVIFHEYFDVESESFAGPFVVTPNGGEQVGKSLAAYERVHPYTGVPAGVPKLFFSDTTTVFTEKQIFHVDYNYINGWGVVRDVDASVGLQLSAAVFYNGEEYVPSLAFVNPPPYNDFLYRHARDYTGINWEDEEEVPNISETWAHSGPSLAVDLDGYSIIAYHVGGGGVGFAYRYGAHDWEADEVDSRGEYPSLAVDVEFGHIAIAYYVEEELWLSDGYWDLP